MMNMRERRRETNSAENEVTMTGDEMIGEETGIMIQEVQEAMMPEITEVLGTRGEIFMVETMTIAAETDTVQDEIQVHQGQKE